ncbi:MAG: hypothetical protein KGL59_10590 [Acidobacteriota bacterium]|nr:hypothetical protein [Acidobacteriota bacterium]
MAEWHYAQAEPSEELALLHFFSMKKHHAGGDVTFRITVREFATPPHGHHQRFFAEADKAVNQKTAAVLPCGWGDTVLVALSDCLRMIRQFPYEGDGA